MENVAQFFKTFKPEENDEEDSNEEEGDFEDLEEPQIGEDEKDATATDEQNKRKEELKRKFDAQYDNEDDADDSRTFYQQQKDDMAVQAQLNEAEFAGMDPEGRAKLEGYKAGLYVRIVINNVACEFTENFNSDYPIIMGGLQQSEEALGFIQVRIKKHRWYKRILKTNDPLIFSLGWRRFQTMPLYSINSDATRNRMLKYTPEHMHCLATFYGTLC